MAGGRSLLFRSSWMTKAALLGALASTMAIAAVLFRHIARRAAAGACADPSQSGIDAHCAMAAALGGIGGWLSAGAILFAGATFVCAFMAWRQKGQAGR
jgi:hypothetical protein